MNKYTKKRFPLFNLPKKNKPKRAKPTNKNISYLALFKLLQTLYSRSNLFIHISKRKWRIPCIIDNNFDSTKFIVLLF